jgi:hypothetical protein
MSEQNGICMSVTEYTSLAFESLDEIPAPTRYFGGQAVSGAG